MKRLAGDEGNASLTGPPAVGNLRRPESPLQGLPERPAIAGISRIYLPFCIKYNDFNEITESPREPPLKKPSKQRAHISWHLETCPVT